MKSITILFIAIIACLSLQAQQTDWKKKGLKGNVQSVTESGSSRHYNYSKKNFSGWEKKYIEKTLFDHIGRAAEYQKTDTAGTLLYSIKYNYNIKGGKTPVQYYDKDGLPSSKELWIYNNKNQKTEEQNLSKDGAVNYRYTYAYDDAGNIISKTSYLKDDKVFDKTAYTYDTKKNLITDINERGGAVQTNRKYSYDAKANRTGEIWYNTKNEIDYRYVYVYDAQGNMTHSSTYKSDSDIEWNQSDWTYVYDKQNNWIKRTSLDPDGIELNVTDRVIIYY